MSLDPGHMVDRLRSYAQAIADDQSVTLNEVLRSMQAALATFTHTETCHICAMAGGHLPPTPPAVLNMGDFNAR